MRQLIWKEWHEQSWRLGFGCLVLGAMTLIGLHARILNDNAMMMWVCFIGITLLPMLSITGLLPAERSEGIFESLLALPIAPWKILASKTAMGLALCAGPMVVAAVISLLAAGGRELLDQDILHLYADSTLSAISLLLWMMALTSRLPSEARAGLLASGILILWILATAGLAHPSVPPLARAISPLVFVYQFSSDQTTVPLLPESINLFVAAVIAIVLWTWTAKRLTGDVEGES
jgi:ABC-type transport system involved in multi-copper enzyme maturation permease subunit